MIESSDKMHVNLQVCHFDGRATEKKNQQESRYVLPCLKTKGAMISLGVKATMIKAPRDLIKSHGNYLLTPIWGLHLLKRQGKTLIPIGIFIRKEAYFR